MGLLPFNPLPSTMLKFVVLSALVAIAASQLQQQEIPQPYSYSFDIPVGDHSGTGQIARQESADGSGRVVGSYTITHSDGRQRIVNYVADEAGFRATIQTNEPGTKSESPADVNFVSSAVDPIQAVVANGQRARFA